MIKSPILWAYGLYCYRIVGQFHKLHTIHSSPLSYLILVLQSMIISCWNLLEANNYRPPKVVHLGKTHGLRCFWLFPLHRGMVSLWHNKNMCRVLRANKSNLQEATWEHNFLWQETLQKTSSCNSHKKGLLALYI